jgi:LPXTG-motif cell wall-anchored protein
VAYDETGFKAGTAPRATAPAVLALAGTDLVEVSETGATGPAPRLACAPPSSPSPSSPPPSPSPSTPSGTHTATTNPTQSGAASGGAAAGGGSLPATGAPTAGMAALAGLLLATGCGLLVLARRRGVPRPDLPRRVAGR